MLDAQPIILGRVVINSIGFTS